MRARKLSSRRTAATLIELVLSTLLVGGLMISALQSLGASVRSSRQLVVQTQASQLAIGLLAEISELDYEDANEPGSFGLESDESSATTRDELDDVDDFDGWTEDPPADRTGNQLAGLQGWTRDVTVEYVDPADLTDVTSSDMGVKRITVRVIRSGIDVGQAVGFQTISWINMVPIPGNNETTGSLPPGNSAPTAVAAASPLYGTATVDIDFDASQSFDPDGDSLTYDWDFGGGATAVGPNPSHTFENLGLADLVVSIQLTVTDADGAQSTDTISITVLSSIE